MSNLIDLLKMSQDAYSPEAFQKMQTGLMGIQKERQGMQERQQMKELFARGDMPGIAEMGAISPEEAMKMQQLNRQGMLDEWNIREKQSNIQKTQRELTKEETKQAAWFLGANADQYYADVQSGVPEPQAREVFNHRAGAYASEHGQGLPGSFDPNKITPPVGLMTGQQWGYQSKYLENQQKLGLEQGLSQIPERAQGARNHVDEFSNIIPVPAASNYNPQPASPEQDSIRQINEDVANRFNIHPGVLNGFVGVESNFGKNNFNPEGGGWGAGGPFQIRKDFAQDHGLTEQSRFDPALSAQATAEEFARRQQKYGTIAAINMHNTGEQGYLEGRRAPKGYVDSVMRNIPPEAIVQGGGHAPVNPAPQAQAAFPVQPPQPTGNPTLDSRNKVGYEKARIDFQTKQAEEARQPELQAAEQTAKAKAAELQAMQHSINVGEQILKEPESIKALIKGSTSGFIQKKAAEYYGGVTGEDTTGMQDIGELKVVDANLLELANQFPGQQSDKELLQRMAQVANVSNPDIPANTRIKAFDKFLEVYKAKIKMAKKLGGKVNAPPSDQDIKIREGELLKALSEKRISDDEFDRQWNALGE